MSDLLTLLDESDRVAEWEPKPGDRVLVSGVFCKRLPMAMSRVAFHPEPRPISECVGHDIADRDIRPHTDKDATRKLLNEVVRAAVEHREARGEYNVAKRERYDNGEPVPIPVEVADRWADSAADLDESLTNLEAHLRGEEPDA